jgi:hypothetical protein
VNHDESRDFDRQLPTWSGTITIKQAVIRTETKDDHVCCKSTSVNSPLRARMIQ